ILNSTNIKPNCKIMIDIEAGAFTAMSPSAEYIQSMVETFVNTVNSQLGEQEYVVYASASFISKYFSKIDSSKYGLIVSSVATGNNQPMTAITYPEYPYSPICYNDYPNNWGNNWTGVQFAFGAEQDYDIYKNDFLI
ncbi:MAG: hypothetical protein ACRCTZ_05710, partial [Sarcina sp.]